VERIGPVIVGGGIAGLAVAHELARRGIDDAVVLEAEGRPGGNIRTHAIDGYSIEEGPNGFLDNVPATLALVERLGLGARLLPSSDAARKRFLWRRGALRRLPEGPASFLTSPLLSLSARLRVLAEPFARRRPAREETVHEFASRRIGEEAATVLVSAMVSGVFGGDSRALSLESAFPKMYDMETRHGGLVRAMLARMRQARRDPSPRRSGGGPAGPGGVLTSFDAGLEILIRALAAEAGSRLRLGARVESIGFPGSAGIEVRLSGGEILRTPAAVLAVPAWDAARILDHDLEDAARILRSIPPAPIAVVATGFRREDVARPLDGFGFLAPRIEDLRILGCLWDSSIFPGRAPDGRILMRTMIGGYTDPRAPDLDDEALSAIVLRDLDRTVGIRAAPVLCRIFRYPMGIPQYTRGHPDRMRALDAIRERMPGLHLAGNSYRGISVNRCVEDAAPVADAVVAGLRARALRSGL